LTTTEQPGGGAGGEAPADGAITAAVALTAASVATTPAMRPFLALNDSIDALLRSSVPPEPRTDPKHAVCPGQAPRLAVERARLRVAHPSKLAPALTVEDRYGVVTPSGGVEQLDRSPMTIASGDLLFLSHGYHGAVVHRRAQRGERNRRPRWDGGLTQPVALVANGWCAAPHGSTPLSLPRGYPEPGAVAGCVWSDGLRLVATARRYCRKFVGGAAWGALGSVYRLRVVDRMSVAWL
jgi:hypothetical protein